MKESDTSLAIKTGHFNLLTTWPTMAHDALVVHDALPTLLRKCPEILGSSRVVQTFGEVRAFGVSYLSTFLSLPAHLYWNFYFLSTPHNYHLDGAVGQRTLNART